MGNGKKAREGILRACMSHSGKGFEEECWKDASQIYRRALGLALGRKTSKLKLQTSSNSKAAVTENEAAEMLESRENQTAEMRYANARRVSIHSCGCYLL